jgi:predicted nucleic acid-binding protein
MPAGLTLDTGALVAVERGNPRVRALLRRAIENQMSLHIPAWVVARAWRGGSRQARMARLLTAREVRVVALDELTARAVGVLCGMSGHVDVVDVHVVLHTREHHHHVITSDPADLARVDPTITLITV